MNFYSLPAIQIPGVLNWGKSGTDYQGPNGGGGPRKAWNKNVVFIYLFIFISR